MAPKITITKANGERVYPPSELRWVEFVSKWLDSNFVIPGTKIRFGLDPILSLLPVAGDLITWLISASLIYTMHRQGASREVVIKMVLNSTVDALIGAIPLVGTVFDVFYRSNERNLKLLKEHYAEGRHQGSGTGIVIALLVGALMIVTLIVYGLWKLFEAIF